MSFCILRVTEQNMVKRIYPAPFLQNTMEQYIKDKQSKYTLGDTGLNKVGLFARVSPGLVSAKMVRNLRFCNANSRFAQIH